MCWGGVRCINVLGELGASMAGGVRLLASMSGESRCINVLGES